MHERKTTIKTRPEKKKLKPYIQRADQNGDFASGKLKNGNLMHALGLWAKSNEKGLQAAANIKSAQAQPWRVTESDRSSKRKQRNFGEENQPALSTHGTRTNLDRTLWHARAQKRAETERKLAGSLSGKNQPGLAGNGEENRSQFRSRTPVSTHEREQRKY
jgi:hypothetical protein